MTSVLFYNPDNTPEELAHLPPPQNNNAGWPCHNNNTHNHQSWKEDIKPPKPPKIPGLARLNILQGFSLLGGAGSVVHEIHAIEYQKALALASSDTQYHPWTAIKSKDAATSTTTTTTDVTTETKTEKEGEVKAKGGEQLWPWSWAQKLQSVTTGSRGTMKRYRITIEELPGEVSVDGSPLASTSTIATSVTMPTDGLESVNREEVAKKVATTTAMMPMGFVEWLLNVSYDRPYGFREPAPAPVLEDEGIESLTAAVVPVIVTADEKDVVVPQVPLPDHDLSSVPVTLVAVAAGSFAPPTSECVGAGDAGPEPALVATKIQSPPPAAPTATSGAVVDSLAVASATPVPTPVSVNAKPSDAAAATPSASSSSVLVNKVMEVRPSWDNSTSTSTNNGQDASSRAREWPPRRHQRNPFESFTQTTITRPDGTIESKTVTFNRQSGVTETHTRIQRPDGSFLESSTHRTNPASRESAAQEQMPQTRHEGGNPYRNHLNRVAAQQQQQQHDAEVVTAAATPAAAAAVATAASTYTPFPPTSSSSPPNNTSNHRPSFRERWAKRRQEHREFLEDLRAERECERPHVGADQERGRQDERKRERRQELRDAEARQREATAAAYGFVPNSSSTSSSTATSEDAASNWPHSGRDHDRRNRDYSHHHRHRRNHREEEEEEDDEGRYGYRSRSWPPKGYLKRQEREQQEQPQPRHNV